MRRCSRWGGGGAALSDETRNSVGYENGNRKHTLIDGTSGESDLTGWYLLGEGDQGDFLYRLSYSDRSDKLAGRDLGQNVTQGYLGWHGLALGEFGFGPAIWLVRYSYDDATNSDTTRIGGGAGGAAVWDSGLGFDLDAELHISDALTLSAGWGRISGELKSGAELEQDLISLGGRFRFADSFFVEGGLERENLDASNGTDRSGTVLRLGGGRCSGRLHESEILRCISSSSAQRENESGNAWPVRNTSIQRGWISNSRFA